MCVLNRYPVSFVLGTEMEHSQCENYHGDDHKLLSHDWKALYAESNYLASRCSAQLVYDVLSKLDIQKKELVKAIGFRWPAAFPPLRSLNRKRFAWLMSKVDLPSQSIVLGA